MDEMNKLNKISEMADVFGGIFYLSNTLQTIIDRDLSDKSLTTKQWYLLAVTSRFFTYPPKLSEVAEQMGTSYQNVKQLALKLEKTGFVELKRDENDKRALRIMLTEACEEYFKGHHEFSVRFFDSIFRLFSPAEIDDFLEMLIKLSEGIHYHEEGDRGSLRERLGR